MNAPATVTVRGAWMKACGREAVDTVFTVVRAYETFAPKGSGFEVMYDVQDGDRVWTVAIGRLVPAPVDSNPDDAEMDDGTLCGALARNSGLKPSTNAQINHYRSVRDRYVPMVSDYARECECDWNLFIAAECHRAAMWAWAEQN